jgi:hypothetical protein
MINLLAAGGETSKLMEDIGGKIKAIGGDR